MTENRAARVEITPEMVEAGVASWRDWDTSDDGFPERLVTAVFLSMVALLKPCSGHECARRDAQSHKTHSPGPLC